jgi:hypothetical protein
MRSPRRLLALLPAALTACSGDPVAPRCELPDAGAARECQLAAAPIAAEGQFGAWASKSTPMKLAGYPDGLAFTPAALTVTRTLRGAEATRLDVLVPGCVGETGASAAGPLAGTTGYALIDWIDGYYVMQPQGWFWREGAVLENVGAFSAGIAESEFLARLGGNSAGAGCP